MTGYYEHGNELPGSKEKKKCPRLSENLLTSQGFRSKVLTGNLQVCGRWKMTRFSKVLDLEK